MIGSDWILAILVSAAMLAGALFSVVAALGLMRFPDLMSRMHAASKAGSVGSGLLLAALAMTADESADAVKAIAAIIFLLFTSPLSAHLLARAARKAGAGSDNL